ncbi:hypothetical protein GW17_00006169 [Ensete ventricosum]|nr:hypothetical protein GW17_00006169 [Ensete ventricosum]
MGPAGYYQDYEAGRGIKERQSFKTFLHGSLHGREMQPRKAHPRLSIRACVIMASIIRSLFGRKTNKLNAQEPLSGGIWEPLGGFSFATTAVAVSPHDTAYMDWKETPDAHVFIADLPGVRKEEVNVEVEEEKVLKISGRRVKESEEKGDKWHRVERNTHKFFRTVRLPHDANTDAMKAKLENGVLTVTVPKEQDRKTPIRFLQIEG